MDKKDKIIEDMKDKMLDLIVENCAMRHALKHSGRPATIEQQEALAERIISQGMTWLYPKFDDKLDDIIEELKKK